MGKNIAKILTLLLAGLIFGLAPSPAEVPSSSSKWEPAIRAFEKSDQLHPPPQRAVLFYGSSAIRKWTTLAQDFPGVTVINRGFGGAQISDCTAFASRVVIPYHPRVIVFYDGENDLAAGKTPDQVVTDCSNFVAVVAAQLPHTRILFLSLKPSPVRWKKLKDGIMETNRRIASMQSNRLIYVDVFSHMLDADGHPQMDLFLADKLHPNEKCYSLWASLIRPYLN